MTDSIFAKNRTGLVTGAWSGIGLALAKAVAPKFDRVVLVARRLDRLNEAAQALRLHAPGLEVIVHAADLSVPQEVELLSQSLSERGVSVDALVNNAGLGEAELFEQSSWSRIDAIIKVNILAALRLTHDLLPAMIDRGHGAVLNIGSGAGYAAMPNAVVYTASKHFIRAFTESLRAQLAGKGVLVSEAAPGSVESEFDQVAGIEGSGATPRHRAFRISADDCAEDVVRAFERAHR